MAPDADPRFDEVVRQILDSGSVPQSERADLGEEIAGHLVERASALRAEGLDGEAAVARAIADFGAASTIGREFREAYYSRLWVSTIGVLLPVAAAPGEMPGGVRWVARGGSLLALMSLVLAVLAGVTMSPGRAALLGGFLGIGGLIIWLAAEGLRRHQSWGWTVMTWVLAVQAFILVWSLSSANDHPSLSINGLIGSLLLLLLLANGAALRDWVRGSGSLPRPLAVGIAVAMLGWAILPFTGPGLPDPTQAASSDIHVAASVACGIDPTFGSRNSVTVALDVAWDRVDILPLGIARAGEDWGDSVKLDSMDNWLAGGPRLIDTVTGQDLDQNGAYGLTMPASFDGSSDAGIDASVMRSGHPARLSLVAYNADDLAPYPTSLTIRYAHRDQFILKTMLVCGGHGTLVPEPVFDGYSSVDLLTGRPLEP